MIFFSSRLRSLVRAINHEIIRYLKGQLSLVGSLVSFKSFETIAVDMLPFFFLLPFISLLKISAAAPARAHFDDRSVTALSAADLTSLAPYTRFARVAHCPTSKLKGWNCGIESFLFSFSVATKVFTLTAICNALPGFQPTLIGGDGNAVKFVGVNLISFSFKRPAPFAVFVGFWPA
jgi:hypothetical protein